jgi:hypothetical protein
LQSTTWLYQKKFLARAIAEFKNNVSGESFHATQEQKRFISFCLETRNEYLLSFFNKFLRKA